MRGFIITSVLFILLLIMIFSNFYFVKTLINDMQKNVNLLNSIPCKENAIIIEKLIAEWEKDSIWLSFSVSYDNIEELTNILDSLKATNSTENFEQFQIHVELLLNAIEEIGRLEKFSIKNIL